MLNLNEIFKHEQATVPETLSNERGSAIIIVLLSLLLLTILGATLLTSSTSELQVAGNQRSMYEAFFAAEAAMTHSLVNPDIYTTIIPGAMNSYSSSSLIVGNKKTKIKVQYIASSDPPPGSGMDDTFQANYFVVSATGNSNNNTQVVMESGIARILPKAKGY